MGRESESTYSCNVLAIALPLLERVFFPQLTRLPHGDKVPIMQETVPGILYLRKMPPVWYTSPSAEEPSHRVLRDRQCLGWFSKASARCPLGLGTFSTKFLLSN